ncbi:MAG TPA: hypothetical protein VFY26_09190, partial [Anaerolineales bacterium]|nr:hypothetical protein [Anaerolineales bacterium]
MKLLFSHNHASDGGKPVKLLLHRRATMILRVSPARGGLSAGFYSLPDKGVRHGKEESNAR